MSVNLTIHLSRLTYSRMTFASVGEPFGALYLDESRDVNIMGTEEQMRVLADQLLELADEIAYRSYPLSADEVRLREATRQGQHLRLLAQRLERTGGEFRRDLDADGLEPWQRELLAGGGDL